MSGMQIEVIQAFSLQRVLFSCHFLLNVSCLRVNIILCKFQCFRLSSPQACSSTSEPKPSTGGRRGSYPFAAEMLPAGPSMGATMYSAAPRHKSPACLRLSVALLSLALFEGVEPRKRAVFAAVKKGSGFSFIFFIDILCFYLDYFFIPEVRKTDEAKR